MRLPYEDDVRGVIRERLNAELELGSRILDLGIRIFVSGKRIQPGAGVDDSVVVVALGLIAKACKQYRAIGELVEMGVGEVADSNARMLFETMLAAHFLLRRRISLKQNGKKIADVKGKPLTTKFRAELYLANDAFNGRKFVRGLADTPGLKRKIGGKNRAVIEKAATDFETEIGPEWTRRVKERGYAGINVKDLAESLGYGQLYPSIYRITSAGVHATDSTDFIHLDEDTESSVRFSVSARTEGVANTLKFASLVFLNIIEAAETRLGLGLKKSGDELMEEVKRMRGEFPDR
jgi:hypothetical protein